MVISLETYKGNIRYKKNIKDLMKRLPCNTGMEEDSYEKQILCTVKLLTNTHKIHMKRYGFQIGILLLMLIFTFPLFFLVNVGIFTGMFFYIILYDRNPANQAFNSITLLLNCINELHKENPEKCKGFIIKNELEEIKDLKMLYQAVLKIK